jgi:hypothetical protein
MYRLKFNGAIAVGRPVTQPPPHGSRRAVFSHRALQSYSLPQVGLGLEDCLSRRGSSTDPWAGHFAALQDFVVALPGVPVAWTTPIEPLSQNPYGFVEELLQAGSIPVDSVVIGGPTELGVQPLDKHGQS